jgi:hypothetical protein
MKPGVTLVGDVPLDLSILEDEIGGAARRTGHGRLDTAVFVDSDTVDPTYRFKLRRGHGRSDGIDDPQLMIYLTTNASYGFGRGLDVLSLDEDGNRILISL